MRIGLMGKGKMGRAIEKLAPTVGAEVVPVERAEICLEFSVPSAVVEHVKEACDRGSDLVIGTTGFDEIEHVKKMVNESGIGCIYSPNFSLGVWHFRQLIKQMATKGYEMGGIETHAASKIDRPSGTAKLITRETGIPFESIREGEALPEHRVTFEGPHDIIEITHKAKSRDTYALGALEAAKWVHGKKGFFTISDIWN